MRSTFLIVFSLCCVLHTAAQLPSYPKGYFRNPLRIPILLAGNFGECRPGHFHSGMDIKTGGHENEPVYAAADGYISRIKTEPGGFGHALYITHPNGYTTLYAHLNDFTPALQQYLRQQQYAKESWTQDIQLRPDQFPVKKGQHIAWSGNTGGSTAPHLHFEIRSTLTEHPLNGQQFGFDVKDTKPPVLRNLYFYDLGLGVYESTPKVIALLRKGERYVPAGGDTIALPGDYVGAGIVADDYSDGSENTLAPYALEWSVGDASPSRITLDDIGYDETRYLHAYADYKTKFNGGPWVQCLFRTPGNALKHIYDFASGQQGPLGHEGGIALGDAVVPVKIRLLDDAGNESSVQFWLKRLKPGKWQYSNCTTVLWSPNQRNASEQDPYWTIRLPENALYDRMCYMNVMSPDTAGLSQQAAIGRPEVPLHVPLTVSVRPDRLIPFALRSKLAVIVWDGKSWRGAAAAPAEHDRYTASIRSFGRFHLVADTSAPALKPLQAVKANLQKVKSIAFRTTDNYTSVRAFRGEIDGHWVLFEQHEDVWTYVFDGHCPKGRHILVLKATDENGNESTATYTFTR